MYNIIFELMFNSCIIFLADIYFRTVLNERNNNTLHLNNYIYSRLFDLLCVKACVLFMCIFILYSSSSASDRQICQGFSSQIT